MLARALLPLPERECEAQAKAIGTRPHRAGAGGSAGGSVGGSTGGGTGGSTGGSNSGGTGGSTGHAVEDFSQSITALRKAAARQHGAAPSGGTRQSRGPWDPPWPRQPGHSVRGAAGMVPAPSSPRAQPPAHGESPAPLSWHSRMRPMLPGLCRGRGGDASAGGAFWGLSAVGWYPFPTLGFGEAKAQGISAWWGAAAPCPNLRPGQLLVLGQRLSLSPPTPHPYPPPPADPSPSLPSGRPRGCSVSLKGLQAWLWDRHPIPTGQGTGQSRTALDSRRQPHWHTVDRSLRRYRGRHRRAVGGLRGLGGGTRDGDPSSPAPAGVLRPIAGGASPRAQLGTPGLALRGPSCERGWWDAVGFGMEGSELEGAVLPTGVHPGGHGVPPPQR